MFLLAAFLIRILVFLFFLFHFSFFFPSISSQNVFGSGAAMSSTVPLPTMDEQYDLKGSTVSR